VLSVGVVREGGGINATCSDAVLVVLLDVLATAGDTQKSCRYILEYARHPAVL
jgi:hypothetical protein